MGLVFSNGFLNKKGLFSGLHLLGMQRLGSRKPIQNIRFKKVVKSGSLHNVSRTGEHDVFHQVSLSLHILPLDPRLWLWKSKKDFSYEMVGGNHTKSPVWERWNLIWTFGHQFLSSTVNICLKYDLSWAGEIYNSYFQMVFD